MFNNIKWEKVYAISIFDHWLSEEEADGCLFLTYQISKENNLLDLYLIRENNFISFYKGLGEKVSIVKGNSLFSIRTDSDQFDNILTKSLREKEFFEIYYPSLNLLAKGGYDRTDTLFLSSSTHKDNLTKLIEKNKLSILSVIDYAEYINNNDFLNVNNLPI